MRISIKAPQHAYNHIAFGIIILHFYDFPHAIFDLATSYEAAKPYSHRTTILFFLNLYIYFEFLSVSILCTEALLIIANSPLMNAEYEFRFLRRNQFYLLFFVLDLFSTYFITFDSEHQHQGNSIVRHNRRSNFKSKLTKKDSNCVKINENDTNKSISLSYRRLYLHFFIFIFVLF